MVIVVSSAPVDLVNGPTVWRIGIWVIAKTSSANCDNDCALLSYYTTTIAASDVSDAAVDVVVFGWSPTKRALLF